MNDPNQQLLIAILQTLGRIAVPGSQLVEMIGKGKNSYEAYLLCDGTKTQSEIVKMLNLNKGNFSGVVSRWVKEGILFRIGQGRDVKLLHLYAPSKKIKEK